MSKASSAAVLVSLAASLAGGCAPPTVAVRHVLPGALPVPEGLTDLGPGRFTVRAGPKGDWAEFAAAALANRLGRGRDPNAPAAAGSIGRVDGTIEIVSSDRAGTRRLRAPAAGGGAKVVSVPTLVRTAEVRVVYTVRTAAGAEVGSAEVRRSYNSAADARVRGELGLGRGDDPDRVPPLEQIVHELLGQCAAAFVGLVSPVVIEAAVPLRPAGGQAARAGMDAAAKGDWAAALEGFSAAIAAAPQDPAARFDCAVVAEAAGRFPEALEHYRRAWELSERKDPAAAEGLARVRRVLTARKKPAGK